MAEAGRNDNPLRKIRNKNLAIGLIALVLFILFMVWRFVRPLHTFVVDERFERPMAVEVPEGLSSLSAEECGGCHEEIYEEWLGSMHAKAWTDPYYQVDYRFDGSQQICLNCHIPLENQQENRVVGFRDNEKFDPILQPNPDFDVELQQEGVTCAVCHVKDGKIVGPFGTEDAPHPVAVDREMTAGIKACQKCHVVSGEKWDTFLRIPPCGTVAEIQEGGREIDCLTCHMPAVTRPVATGMDEREGSRHLFRGGHDPEMVKSALTVSHEIETGSRGTRFILTLTNTGADHYLPTGTPDRHLTLELKLFDQRGELLKEEKHTMMRHILWRPFIVDLIDTRLPPREPRKFDFEIPRNPASPAARLDVTVSYHLLEESRRKRIGYQNREPIHYPIYQGRFPL